MSNQYLTMFDCEGFECMFDITSKSEEAMMAKLQGKEPEPLPFDFWAMRMRATLNSHRKPEIWVFNTEDTIDLEILNAMMDDCPQQLADLIRSRGTNLFPRELSKPPVIV